MNNTIDTITAAARENGKKGGRPRKSPLFVIPLP